MLITLWIFTISGTLLIIMIGFTMAGASGEGIPGWPALRAKTDPFFDRKIKQSRAFFAQFERGRVKDTGTLVVQKSKHRVSTLKEKAASKVMPFTNYIKGKRAIDPNAKASRFLHDVKKSKEEGMASEDRHPLS